MNLVSPLDGIRQGMQVHDPAGVLVGYVRDVSGRAVLVIEPSGPRVFWVEGDNIDRLAEGAVRLRKPVHVPGS